MNWQPIETAPNNQWCLIFDEAPNDVDYPSMLVARWEDGYWRGEEVRGTKAIADCPTHWMPLPNSPEIKK